MNETRESFHQELSLNQKQLVSETANVRQVSRRLDDILNSTAAPARNPNFLAAQVASLSPSFYFFRTTAWESAVSSGVLGHINTDEVNRYSDAYLSVKNYQQAQRDTAPVWISVESFFRSRRTPSREDLIAGEEKLRMFQMQMGELNHLAGELQDGLSSVIGK